MASTQALDFDPRSSLGASLLAFSAYTYYGRFPEDSRGLKFLVSAHSFIDSGMIQFCEVGHAICLGEALYERTVSDYGNPQRLFLLPASTSISFLFSGTIGACVQGFFTLRIYRLSKSIYIPAFIWILSFSRILFSIVAVIYGTQPNLIITTFVVRRAWVLYVIWAVSTATDLIIAATLVYWLYRQRTNARKRTVALVDKLITWTIGSSTHSPCSIPFDFSSMRNNYGWVAFYAVTARLYANSLLASLNSRATLRAMNEVTLPISGLAFPTANNEMSTGGRGELPARSQIEKARRRATLV
ncbi:hypothetical protein FB451DRAFT_1221636 [Mycena latifolia]|nr:hypothetical protein FB451DRAFT_1221636 [Mycena latifolia]